MNTDLLFASITDVSHLLRSRQITAIDLTHATLDRIRRFNPTLNAFITETAELALRQAELVDAELGRGLWRGPLHGIPISLKDLIDTAGVRTTAGSAVFADRIPQHDAEVVHRLRRAGAVIVGKTNLHEMAYGGSGIIGHYGTAKNPWNRDHITGGSSSGGAAAVAAGMGFAAISTDTAGSVRLPAAFCGLVGYKPTYGSVSVQGIIPLSWTYDHVGPIARSVTDAAIVLNAIAGYDPADPNSEPLPLPDYVHDLQSERRTFRIGLPKKNFFEELDSDIAARVEEAIKLLQKVGCTLHDVDIPLNEDRTVSASESFAYHKHLIEQHSDKYKPETLARLRKGEPISAAQYIEKFEDLRKIRLTAQQHFATVDVVIIPTTPIPAPSFAELDSDRSQLRDRELQMLRNLRPFNVLGAPAISIPCGLTSRGLPVGIQIAAAPKRDSLVLQVARSLEKQIGWIPAVLPKS